jgi:hypothetical protein
MPAKRQFVVCLRNTGYEVSLERHKTYRVLSDRAGAKHGQLRVVDESGEDYLYPASYFARQAATDQAGHPPSRYPRRAASM